MRLTNLLLACAIFPIATSEAVAQTRPVPAVVFMPPASTFPIAIPRITLEPNASIIARLSTGEPLSQAVLAVDGPKARPSPWYAPLASLALPGSGQALLKQQRSIGYLVAETFLVIRAGRTQHEKHVAITEYRRLASEVARASFGADRPNGTWDYYETLESTDYPSSGAYNLTPGGTLTPETDPSTYNGKQWLQARELNWTSADSPPPITSAEYQRAIEFYQARAVQGSFRWSWRDHQLEQTAYIQAIKDANRSNQQMVTAIGIVAANHLVSLVDAYINVRVRRYGGAGLSGVSIGTEVAPTNSGTSSGYRASFVARVPLPQW